MMDGQMYCVRFRRADDGGCGELVSVNPWSWDRDRFREEVFTNGPADAGVNVTVKAVTAEEAITEARKRGNAYGRKQRERSA